MYMKMIQCLQWKIILFLHDRVVRYEASKKIKEVYPTKLFFSTYYKAHDWFYLNKEQLNTKLIIPIEESTKTILFTKRLKEIIKNK